MRCGHKKCEPPSDCGRAKVYLLKWLRCAILINASSAEICYHITTTINIAICFKRSRGQLSNVVIPTRATIL